MAISGSEPALMHSRLGVARLGATRLDHFNFVMIINLNGATVDVEDVTKNTMEIIDMQGQASEALIGFNPGVTPVAGQPISIAFGDASRLEFGGHIVNVSEEVTRGEDGQQSIFYLCQCEDFTYLLNRRRVSKKYPGQTADSMMKAIVADYVDGFTTEKITTMPSIPEMEFADVWPAEAFNRIMRMVDGRWYTDPEKDIHAFTGATESGVDSPADIVPGNTTYGRLIWFPGDVTQVKTRIKVVGRGTETTSRVDPGATVIPVAETEMFDPANPNAGMAKLGVEEPTYTGRSVASGPGNITGVPASGAGSITSSWPQGTPVQILVIVDDTAAQTALAAVEGGDGVHEFPVTDGRLNLDGCKARGDWELARYKASAEGGKVLQTRDKFMKVGRSVTINLPGRGVSGTFEIQRTITRMLAPERITRDVDFGPFRTDMLDLLTRQTIPAGEV